MKKFAALCATATALLVAAGCVTVNDPAQTDQPVTPASNTPVASMPASSVAPDPGSVADTVATAPPTPQSTQEPTAEPTASPLLPFTGHIVDQGNGYEITLPDGWTRIDPNDPQVADMLSSLSGFGDISWLLFGTDGPAPASTSSDNRTDVLEVASFPSGGKTLGELIQEAAAGTNPLFGHPSRAKRTTLSAGPAGDLLYSYHQNGIDLTGHEYVIPAADNDTDYAVVVLRIGHGPSIQKLALKVANSFGLLP